MPGAGDRDIAEERDRHSAGPGLVHTGPGRETDGYLATAKLEGGSGKPGAPRLQECSGRNVRQPERPRGDKEGHFS